MSTLLAALLLAAAPPQAPWSADVAGVTVSITATDIGITRSGRTILSLRDEFRAAQEALMRERVPALASVPDDPPETVADAYARYTPLSLVGPYLSLAVEDGGYMPGMSHPSGSAYFRVIDVRDPGRAVALDALFPPAALRNALAHDPVVAEHLGPQPPHTLAAVMAKLDRVAGCEVTFLYMLKSFAFYQTEKGRVAVRIGLLPPCDVKPYEVTQLGIWLPVPEGLRADLEAAHEGTAGFLMRDARFAPTSLAFEKDLKPLLGAARARRKGRSSGPGGKPR